MDITLDIGAAVLGVAVPLIAFWFNDTRKKNANKAQRDAKLQREVEERKEQDRIEAERSYQELKEAVSIHESLTDLEVAKSLESSKPADKEFLVALHKRSSARFDAFRQDFSIPKDIADLIIAALTRIHKKWPDETRDAHRRAVKKAKQNHTKNELVQARIVDFAETLRGSDYFAGVEVSKQRQSVHIVLPTKTDAIWFTGNNKGDLPSQIKHRERDVGVSEGKWRDKDKSTASCSFGSASRGVIAQLQKQAGTGEELAEAFLKELEDLAGTNGEGKCTCGVPYLPSRSKALPATE